MNSVQFLQSLLDWLLADPAHVVVAASAIAALTPTPDPTSAAGKLYRIVDLLALNVLRAKDTGLPASPRPAAPAPSGKQSGFSAIAAAVAMAAAGALLTLAGCTLPATPLGTLESVATQDRIAAGKLALCTGSYRDTVKAMAADPQGLGTAIPALCGK